MASVKNADNCDSPKRKDQRLDFSGKLSHVIVSPTHLVKNQTITDFFKVCLWLEVGSIGTIGVSLLQVVENDEMKVTVDGFVDENDFLNVCHEVARANSPLEEVNEAAEKIDKGDEGKFAGNWFT